MPFVKDIVQLALTWPVLPAEGSALVYSTARCRQYKLAVSPAHQVQPQGRALGIQWTWDASRKPSGKDSKAFPGQRQGSTISPPKAPLFSPLPPTLHPWSALAAGAWSLRGPTQPERTADVCMDLQLRMKSHGLF